MTNPSKSLVFFSLLTAALFILGEWPIPEAAAAPLKDDAILVCSTSGTDPIIVMNYGGSAGAPSITPGPTTLCAETIALLLNDGFEIKSVSQGDLRGGFYFFVRNK
ncbi:MAG: hypothetical protein ACU833_00370 [Gammaproteobacteria bacterium]